MAEEIKNTQEEVSESRNFIHAFIEEDIAPGGQYEGMTVHTRFPPEPNGYLHIGHCKALTIDFGTAEKYGGLCNLRMFVEAIKEDIHWLGFDWGDRFFYGSDYFEEDYRQAVGLIKKGLAYVCELSPEQFKEYRGTIGVPAKSPYRDRPMEESLDLFARMRAGEFPNGAMTLRVRDPVLYRINHMHHHRQGDKWCIYPMYDFAHPIQDALEGITHSLCSLEFEAHRPLYNWVVDNCDLPSKPRQIEFARLGIDHTVMSKRKLRALVEDGKVSGWDDPRMPTLCGLRRRGYTPRSIRNFCERIGVAKSANVVEYGFLEHCLREDLNATAERTQGEGGHHSLGGRRNCCGRGSTAVRQSVLGRGPRCRGQEFPGLPESGLPGGAHRLQGGARSGGCRGSRQFPVHAAGLFLPGQQGFQTGTSGVQPQRVFEGQLQKVSRQVRRSPKADGGPFFPTLAASRRNDVE